MKKLLIFIALLCASLVSAQTVPTTPNIGLYTPYHGTTNWDTYMNANFTTLDNYFGGSAVVPAWNVSHGMFQNYLDFAAVSAPANPASGFCRVFFNLATTQWSGITSTGASCSPSGNNTGNTGQLGYYASNGTVLSPDLCTTDGSGHLVCVSFTTSGIGTAKLDFPVGTSPGNPSAGSIRVYGDSGSGLFTCLTSAGATCLTSSVNTQVIANNNGIMAGDSNFTWNFSTHTLTLGSTATFTAPDANTWTSSGIHSLDTSQFIINNSTDSSVTFTGHTFVGYAGIRWALSILQAGTNGAIARIYDNSQSCGGLTFANGSFQIRGASNTSGLCVGDVSGSTAVALPSNTVGTTQSTSDNSTKIATTAFVNNFASFKIANGTAALGTTVIPSTSCATVVTASATGVLSTDVIDWAFNAAPGTGYTGSLHVLAYVTAGNVNFLVCNPTAGSVTPAAATINWKVTR